MYTTITWILANNKIIFENFCEEIYFHFMENNKIFVGNLPFNITEELFKEQYLSVNIEKVDILKLEDGRPSGFAVVYVNSQTKEAIKEIDATEINGRLVSATEYICY